MPVAVGEQHGLIGEGLVEVALVRRVLRKV